MIDTQRQYLGRWLPFVAETRTENDSYAYLQSVLSVPSERRELLCTITADGRFAGLVGFKDTDRANRKTEIGYWLGEEYQGRGIMTRCVEALCGLAFSELDMNRIQIQCAVGNTKSSNIPRRLGFTLEGIARAGELQADGRFSDIEVYSLLREEYIPRGKRTQYDERRNEYAEIEVSGNVTKENIARLTGLGVNYVSSGALTHSAPIMDLSMKNLHPVE